MLKYVIIFALNLALFRGLLSSHKSVKNLVSLEQRLVKHEHMNDVELEGEFVAHFNIRATAQNLCFRVSKLGYSQEPKH